MVFARVKANLDRPSLRNQHRKCCPETHLADLSTSAHATLSRCLQEQPLRDWLLSMWPAEANLNPTVCQGNTGPPAQWGELSAGQVQIRIAQRALIIWFPWCRHQSPALSIRVSMSPQGAVHWLRLQCSLRLMNSQVLNQLQASGLAPWWRLLT